MFAGQNKISIIQKSIFIFLIIFFKNVEFVASEFYSSVHEMSILVENEGKFLHDMQSFLNKNENKLDYLKARLNEYERARDEATVSGPTYFDSPVNQYLLTKRLTVDWERIANLMEHKTAEKSFKRLEETLLWRRGISDDDELKGGIAGLLRLQETYRLKTKDIAAGLLQGVQYDKSINAQLCFDIGVEAVDLQKYRLAHAWFTEALSRLIKEEKSKTEVKSFEKLERAHIMAALADTKAKLGDLNGANSTYVELLDLKPESQMLARTYMVFTLETMGKASKDIDYSLEHEPIPADLSKLSRHDRWKLTCSGHIRKSAREERQLQCGYLTETHPFLLLAPIKVEELNHDPLLVQYYDVLSDSEIEILKNLSSHRISRATVMSFNGSIVSPVRTSQFLFLPKFEHELLETIDQRVQDMTNLDMNYAEDHQFQNYGIGGHYAEHHDFFHPQTMTQRDQVSSLELGNRIATVLFYLSDVEQGGGTAYPYLNLLLMPKKGAAFWHNLHASGHPDGRTLHGGCPIIAGSKWVLNRWIRERHQDQRRPCELFNDIVPGVF